MFSVQLCLLLMSTHITFTQSQNDKYDVQWDQILSKDDQDLKCGIEVKARSSARIINGDLIPDTKYPWMAQIINLLFYSNNTSNHEFRCSGSVISGKAILTAAHCLCREPPSMDSDDDDPDNKCLEIFWKVSDAFPTSPEKIQLRNQNRFHNQVHYAIGSKNSLRSIHDLAVADDPAAIFNEKIKAFIYKYEPEWWEEGTEEERRKRKRTWKNGDIGLIIDESGLDLKTKNVIPVCLPVPNSFRNFLKNKFEVTTAGTGRIYDEYIDKKGRKKTSCMTNEGVARKIGPEYSNIQSVFLQCKDYDRDKKDSCTLVKDATIAMPPHQDMEGYSSKWLTTNIDVSFFPTPSKSGKNVRIKIPRNDECQHLDGKVHAAYKKSPAVKKSIYKTEDGLGPTRIVVFDKGETDSSWQDLYRKWDRQSSPSVPYCYNLKKVAGIGICETESQSYNFGFCSISCTFNDPSDTEKENGALWKMDADYYDTEISAADEFYSKHLSLP